MSAEAEVTEALNAPVDQNAQAAADAKKLLEELSGEGATNGNAESKSDEQPAQDKTNGASESKNEPNRKESDRHNRSPEHRRGDRSDRGSWRGRGRGRGGNFNNRNTRSNNIKSDVTTQEESDDPVAIRKQVSCTAVALSLLTHPFAGRILLLGFQPSA